MKIGETIRDGDFKTEKHLPTIEAPEKVKAGEEAVVKVMVGAEIKHPNTPAHHISWIQLFFKPEQGPVIEVAKFSYVVHNDTMTDTPGPVAAEPASCVKVKLTKSGTLIAMSYCNLHGLWESSKAITVEA
ncbi:MAG: class II SORL domain-containing protein [Synergistes sp.]|nr:class II SORL domain-containing protein [Synergistes sp.]